MNLCEQKETTLVELIMLTWSIVELTLQELEFVWVQTMLYIYIQSTNLYPYKHERLITVILFIEEFNILI